MWVESVSQPNMEELRSIQESTNLVRTHAVSNLSALSPALTISRTTSISSSVIFFDAREYFDSEDEESAYDDAIFQEVVIPCISSSKLKINYINFMISVAKLQP